MNLVVFIAAVLSTSILMGAAFAATPCDSAVYPDQCGYFDSGTLPPYVQDAITAKGGTITTGSVLVLTSGNPGETSTTISNDMNHNGCGTNPDGYQTYDCNLLNNFIPPQDSVVLALSSEWFEWYQTIYTDWMTISGAGVTTVDVSINSWINNKVDIIPYGPMDTGVVILTSLSQSKMIDLRSRIQETTYMTQPSWSCLRHGLAISAAQTRTRHFYAATENLSQEKIATMATQSLTTAAIHYAWEIRHQDHLCRARPAETWSTHGPPEQHRHTPAAVISVWDTGALKATP